MDPDDRPALAGREFRAEDPPTVPGTVLAAGVGSIDDEIPLRLVGLYPASELGVLLAATR